MAFCIIGWISYTFGVDIKHIDFNEKEERENLLDVVSSSYNSSPSSSYNNNYNSFKNQAVPIK